MANLFINQNKQITEKAGRQIHNYYICKHSNCNDISKEEKQSTSKDKKFQHKWLFDPALGQCPHTGILVPEDNRKQNPNEPYTNIKNMLLAVMVIS